VQLERLIDALAPAAVRNDAQVEITDLAYDTRAVTPGALFFCVRGARADGHELAAEATARGAVALVIERPLELDVPQLLVESARRAMAPAAVTFFGDPSRELDVAGVTGTAGKTTTTYLLDAILRAAGRRTGLLGNIERRVGGELRPAALNTPEAIDLQRLLREMADAGDDACVMEATSHASAQGRLDGVRFRVLVFTNLAHEHLDFHGTMEAYFAAKRRLFDQADAAVVNVGDEWGRRLARELPRAVTFDRSTPLDARLALPGAFNVENALAAAFAARALGIGEDAIRAGIESVRGVPGRFEQVDEEQPFRVIVDYAHKPASLENVLQAARELAAGRVICVFGCGGDRDREKRPLMGRIARELADVAIVTSDNPRSEDPLAIIDEIVGSANGLDVEPDRRAAIARAIDAAREGDVVLIAGKGHEQGQEIAGAIHPFDDREVAREALRARSAARA
jgi:UDP-N-acetylmuramoyl-L-alanyl-D-glutamate--2,6-diaminopimelate ligase